MGLPESHIHGVKIKKNFMKSWEKHFLNIYQQKMLDVNIT